MSGPSHGQSHGPSVGPSSVGAASGRPVVAIVPAKDRADSIGATVCALLASSLIDTVVVVDDGSTDATATAALDAGGDPTDHRLVVVVLPRNVGKGAAVAAGIDAAPTASTYVLIDADLGATAAVATTLLRPVLAGDADLAIGVPVTAAGSRGGFGTVKQLAAGGIRRASGFETTAPLSGQRAIRGDVLRSLALADRFGLETAMTIDAVRAGHRVVEVPIEFEHRHTGRKLAGFAHRGRQGFDIVRALWSRATTARMRIGLIAGLAFLFLAVSVVQSSAWEPSSVAGTRSAKKVVVFGMTRLALEDLGTGVTPNVDKLIAGGAFAGTSVRTIAVRPSTVEAYASLGASARVRAGDAAGDAYAPGDAIGLLTAKQLAELRTGKQANGAIVLTGVAETLRANEKRFLPSDPGALGEALHAAGKTTAVVGNSDTGLVADDPAAGLQRPGAIALTDLSGSVDFGTVSPDLLRRDPAYPFGVRLDASTFLGAARAAMRKADVTLLDPGELDRAFAIKPETTDDQFEALRVRALKETDALLGAVVDALPPDTLLIVTAVRPATGTWALTPTVLWGAGVRHGYIHSPSTRRLGLVTLTDLAPTILDSLGLAVQEGMIGHPLRYHPVSGTTDLSQVRDLNSLAGYRERIYLPLTKGYVIFQTIIYLLTILLFSARGGVGRARGAIEWISLAVATWPLATFVFRMIPYAWHLGPFGGLVMIAIDLGIVKLARRATRHPLSPLSWILFATAAINVIDLGTGAHLQQASVLGYSPHTAARFTGIGNAAFAALASTTVLWAAIHVQYSPRRREALWGAGAFCAVVFFADGAPMLGSDVGGILTLVPVFGLLLFVMSGRQLRPRVIAYAGLATVGVLAVATGLDLLRPADSRTHLGRFVTDIRAGGDNTFLTTVGRKLSTNIRVFSGSFWTWIVPLIAIVLLYFLVIQRGWEHDMPRGSALRAGVVAALLCGLLGFAVNDSGTVVTALVFVYMGPFITLLALRRDERPTVLTSGEPAFDLARA